MVIRKEQGLLIATAGVIGLLMLSSGADTVQWSRPRPKKRAYEPVALPPNVLVDGKKLDPKELRDSFRKPTLTSPLPPPDWPDLELPPFPVLPLVEPPLEAGPSLRYWHLRRVDPTELAGQLPKDDKQGGAAAPVPDGAGQDPAGGDAPEADYSRSYDRVVPVGGSKPLWGRILGDDRHGYGRLASGERLTLQPPFQTEVPFQWVNEQTGGVKAERWAIPPDQISSITFANTIENRIAMTRRRIPSGDTGLRDRERFIHELLTREREHPEALEEAERQAREYIAAAPAEPRGWELLTYVYATTGQLEKELVTYDELSQGNFKSHPFVARGRGVLEQRLGLWEDAEVHLRDAVRLDATDPRNRLALSEFLLARRRPVDALAEARAARAQIVPGMSSNETHAIRTQLVRALLAVGANDEALIAVTDAKANSEHPEIRLLEGCVQYARGAYEDAATAFQEAAAAMPLAAMPLIGAGLCAFRKKDLDRALTMFRTASDRDPLQRHVALAAQGFVYLTSEGRIADAVARCEDAQRVAPRNPYVLYLLGRVYREAGRLEESRAVLDRCLREHHDFVEAMVELAWTLLQAARRGADDITLLPTAERLAARAVDEEASRAKLPLYHDLLGVVRYHLGKNERSRRAFEASLAWGGDVHPKLWLALLRNRLGHTEDAISRLRQVGQLLRDDKDPRKVYAEQTRRLLAYHLGKRLFRDPFNTLGKHWDIQKRGQRKVSWRVTDGALRARGSAAREGPTWARYVVDAAKNFIEVEVELTVGAQNDSAVLLRISDERPAGGGAVTSTFECRAGFAFRNGFLYLRSGRQENEKTTTELRAADDPRLRVTPGTPIKIGVKNFRGIDGTARRGEIIVTWNGVEVARRQHTFAATASRPLFVDLRVDCEIADKVDASFDDFRLVIIGSE